MLLGVNVGMFGAVVRRQVSRLIFSSSQVVLDPAGLLL